MLIDCVVFGDWSIVQVHGFSNLLMDSVIKCLSVAQWLIGWPCSSLHVFSCFKYKCVTGFVRHIHAYS